MDMPNFIDRTGQRFGRLIVVRRAENNRHKQTMWECRCDCGKTNVVQAGILISGRTRSCGCLHDEVHLVDMVGQKYGRLTVISRNGSSPHSARWLCRCECGNEKTVTRHCLKHGNTQSCGCLWREQLKKAITKHGRHKTPEYVAWCSMFQRCTNPNATGYENYGGRGIEVCERWNKFENFFEDVGSRPAGMSLDRVDVNGNYEPSNCKWATNKEQRHNKRIDQELLDLQRERDSLKARIAELESR